MKSHYSINDPIAAEREAVAERSAPDWQDGWQFIETAPRDGRQILIGYFKHPGTGDAVVAFWHTQQQAWCTTLQQLTTQPDWQPTHWMALPPRPDGSRIT